MKRETICCNGGRLFFMISKYKEEEHDTTIATLAP